MDYALLTSGTPNNKPQAQWVCNTLDANIVTASDIETKTINHNTPFVPSAFASISGGFSGNYTLGTPISGSAGQSVLISSPSSDWKLVDCRLTYNGESGHAYTYGTGAGFLTDTVGTYDNDIFINGSMFPTNLNVTSVIATGVIVTGKIAGMVILNRGDYIEASFDKGADIVGAPVVQIGGMGFNIFRVA
jgi:hypothetical protein